MNHSSHSARIIRHGLRLSKCIAAPVFALGIAVHVHAAGERVEAPQFKVGDRWKLEQKDKRTGAKEAEFIRTVTSATPSLVEGTENSDIFKMTGELNPVETSVARMSGDPKFLSFPLEVGKKWSFKYTFANKANQGKGRLQLDAEIVAYEKVSVSAGTFDAFRVEAKGYWNNDLSGTSGRSKSVYWYAPQARTVVRTEYEDGYNNWIRELVEYELKP